MKETRGVLGRAPLLAMLLACAACATNAAEKDWEQGSVVPARPVEAARNPDQSPRLTSNPQLTSGVVDRYSGPIADTTGPDVEPSPMAAWPHLYPDAAVELGEWAKTYRDTARALATWQQQSPEKMADLLAWAATWPYQSFDVFMVDRAGWDDLDAIRRADPIAFGAFLTWARDAPTAAREMSIHPEGMIYAFTHADELERAMAPARAPRH